MEGDSERQIDETEQYCDHSEQCCFHTRSFDSEQDVDCTDCFSGLEESSDIERSYAGYFKHSREPHCFKERFELERSCWTDNCELDQREQTEEGPYNERYSLGQTCDLGQRCNTGYNSDQSYNIKPCVLNQQCDTDQNCVPNQKCETDQNYVSNQQCDTDQNCVSNQQCDTQELFSRERTSESQNSAEYCDTEQRLKTETNDSKTYDGAKKHSCAHHQAAAFPQRGGHVDCETINSGANDCNTSRNAVDRADGFVNNDADKLMGTGKSSQSDTCLQVRKSVCDDGTSESNRGLAFSGSVQRSNDDSMNGNRTCAEGAGDNSREGFVYKSSCDWNENQARNDFQMDIKETDPLRHADGRINHSHFSQNSAELTDYVHHNSIESITVDREHGDRILTLGISDCDSSVTVSPHDPASSDACGNFKKVHNFSRVYEPQLTEPAVEFKDDIVYHVDGCSNNDSSDAVNSNIRVGDNSDAEVGKNIDDQNDSFSTRSKSVSIVRREENKLPNMEKTGDLSNMAHIESSLKSGISSNPTKHACQGNKWTRAFAFSFLRKTLHRHKDTDTPRVQGAISDMLPEVRRECMIQAGDHTNSSAVPKKLTFRISDPNGPSNDKHAEADSTVIMQDSDLKHCAYRKVTRRFFLPVLPRVVSTKPQSLDSEVTVSKEDKIFTTDVESGRQSLSPTHQHSEERRKSCPDLEEVAARTERKSKDCRPLLAKFRKWWRSDSSIEGKEIRNTMVVGVAFQLIFTAHFAIQNLQSSLHEEEYLGVSALGCLYATSIFSSIFAPTIIGILGLKGCLVLAWLTHMLYTLAQFHPTWQTLVPASILLGSLTGPTWTAQGVYVSACAFSFSRRSSHSPYTILSRFNGLFFTLYETRQIMGNLLSSGVLRHGVTDNGTTSSQGVIFKYCGPRDCPWAENVTDIEEPAGIVIHSMLAIYMALQVIALVLTVVFLTPLPREEWSSRAPLRQTVTSWFKTLVGTRMLFLVPFMVFQAMEQGILLSEYTKSYVSCPIGIHMVGFVMATHGATSAVFVFVFSRLARRTGRYPLFALASVISLAFLIVLYDWTPQAGQEPLIFTFPVLWGIGEGIWQTQTNSMIAVMFWNRKESAFANYQTWRAVGFTFIFSFHSLLCVDVKIAITMGFLIVGMILYTAVEVHSYRKDRRSSSSATSNTPSKKDLPSKKDCDAGHSDNSVSSSFKENRSPGDNGGKIVEDSRFSPPATTSTVQAETVELRINLNLPAGRLSSSDSSVTGIYPSFWFDDDSDLDSGGHLTLDGTYLSRGESAFLDNDLQKYGVVPSCGCRPLTKAHLAKSCTFDEYDWWEMTEECDEWNSRAVDGGSSDPRATRPHTWHEVSSHDQGELRVLRTKDDVFVY